MQCNGFVGLTDTDDGKTLVREDGLLAAVAAGPVRTAVANFLRARDETRPLCRGVVDAMCDHDATHVARLNVSCGTSCGGVGWENGRKMDALKTSTG